MDRIDRELCEVLQSQNQSHFNMQKTSRLPKAQKI